MEPVAERPRTFITDWLRLQRLPACCACLPAAAALGKQAAKAALLALSTSDCVVPSCLSTTDSVSTPLELLKSACETATKLSQDEPEAVVGPCQLVEPADGATPLNGSCDGKGDGWLYLKVT